MKVDLAKATAVPGITSPAPGLLSVQHPRLVQTFIMLVCVCVCVCLDAFHLQLSKMRSEPSLLRSRRIVSGTTAMTRAKL